MQKQEALEKIKQDFNEIVKTIDDKFGNSYAFRNPELVQHLMDKIQQQEDRNITKIINSIPRKTYD